MTALRTSCSSTVRIRPLTGAICTCASHSTLASSPRRRPRDVFHGRQNKPGRSGSTILVPTQRERLGSTSPKSTRTASRRWGRRLSQGPASVRTAASESVEAAEQGLNRLLHRRKQRSAEGHFNLQRRTKARGHGKDRPILKRRSKEAALIADERLPFEREACVRERVDDVLAIGAAD